MSEDGELSIDELLVETARGHYTELELYAEIFRRLTLDNVDKVIADLPNDVRPEFVDWARERYDNTLPRAGFAIGGEGVRPVPDEAFAALRAWLAAHRAV